MRNKIKNSKIINFLIGQVAVPIVFFVVRFVKDQAFLVRLRNNNLKPFFISYPIYFVVRVAQFFADAFRTAFINYALRKYNDYIAVHYSKYGRGYFSYESLTDHEKRETYGKPNGRVEAFIDQYSTILNYCDGNSFFDVGCGRGQNIKPLRERFQNSFVYGIDLSKEAVEVIKAAVNDDLVKVEAADLKDMNTYKVLEDGAYDHVVMSHVFSLIIDEDLPKTKVLRTSIIKELVRIAKKSVLIIDGPAIVSPREQFVIEQLNRGVFYESIDDYFPTVSGNVMTLRTAESFGVLFTKFNR